MPAETEAERRKRIAEKKRVDEFMAKRAGAGRAPRKPPPTARQISGKETEEFRRGYTPSGLQGLADVMSRKKKKEK